MAVREVSGVSSPRLEARKGWSVVLLAAVSTAQARGSSWGSSFNTHCTVNVLRAISFERATRNRYRTNREVGAQSRRLNRVQTSRFNVDSIKYTNHI